VSLAERIMPAADVSEQISTAGMEASGTGNMKLMLNGALTLGTLDGANVEIREAVGDENFFLFGLTADEVIARKKAGYDPRQEYLANPALREALDLVRDGFFSPEDRSLFKPLVDSLLEEDRYLVLADFAAYAAKQEEVAHAYRDTHAWTRKAILNVAHAGRFSSDRTIHQYAEEIWQVKKTPVP
jgi:starch phosphorylase